MSILVATTIICSCSDDRYNEVFIVPEGYEGPVIAWYGDKKSDPKLIGRSVINFVNDVGYSCSNLGQPVGQMRGKGVVVFYPSGKSVLWNSYRFGNGYNFLSVGKISYEAEYFDLFEASNESCK